MHFLFAAAAHTFELYLYIGQLAKRNSNEAAKVSVSSPKTQVHNGACLIPFSTNDTV